MKKLLTILIIAFAVVGLYHLADNTHDPQEETATSTASSTVADYPEGYTAYQGDDYMIGYPDDFSLVSEDTTMPDAYGSYIPSCGSRDYLACIFYTGDDFEGTNFGAAGVAVRKLSEAATAEECESTEGNYSVIENEQTKEVGDNEFFLFETAEGAMSHNSSDVIYRNFQDDQCWELKARIGSTVYEVYEEGSIDRFTQSDRDQLRDRLEEIVGTFSLVN